MENENEFHTQALKEFIDLLFTIFWKDFIYWVTFQVSFKDNDNVWVSKIEPILFIKDWYICSIYWYGFNSEIRKKQEELFKLMCEYKESLPPELSEDNQ